MDSAPEHPELEGFEFQATLGSGDSASWPTPYLLRVMRPIC